MAKNTPKLQELLKKRSKSSICPIIFHISLKKIHFSTLTFFFGPLTWNRPFTLICTLRNIVCNAHQAKFHGCALCRVLNLCLLKVSTKHIDLVVVVLVLVVLKREIKINTYSSYFLNLPFEDWIFSLANLSFCSESSRKCQSQTVSTVAN